MRRASNFLRRAAGASAAILLLAPLAVKAEGIPAPPDSLPRFVLSPSPLSPAATASNDTAGVNGTRLWILGGSMFAANAGIMWYYFDTFYSPRESERSRWHTFNDWYNGDMNMDKAGHVYGSQMYTNTLYHLFRWTNMSETGSMLWSSILSWIFQFEMENTDAFYRKWGFSWWDVAGNTVGAAWPNIQRICPPLQSFNLKMSYHRSDPLKKGWYNYVLKDYEGFTYWLAVSVHDLLPASWKPYWPGWLGVAVGYGIVNSIVGKDRYNTGPDGRGIGDQEWYIAFDYDLRKLPGDTPFLKFLKEELNLIHLPAPAIRLTPKAIYYGLYF